MVLVKQAVILAGGRGTRLGTLTDNLPKPMISINKKPFLEYLIDILKGNGIEEVILLLGYLPEKIKEHFGDGSKFGISIKYSIGDVSFETGKRIKNAEGLLDDNFLLMYCDNHWPLNLKKIVKYHDNHNVLATVTIYTNKDNVTKSNMKVDNKGYVNLYDKSRKEKNLSGVDIGFFIVNKEVLELMPSTNFSFEKKILPKLIKEKQLAGYLTDHKYYSIGKIERLPITEQFLKSKKVIFLDRDGVINKKPPKTDYVKSWDEFEFLPGAIEALKILKQNGYEIYIISNQAGIARGIMTEDDLKEIHEKMKKELENHGAKVSGIYYCPHGWDERCECRKPKPGMFFQAAREHHIDLTKTIFIGDDERDLQAGNAAGCPTILINPEDNLLKVVKSLVESNPKRRYMNYKNIFDYLLNAYNKSNKKRFMVAIAGCAQSGKTTLAQKIKKNLKEKNIDCIVFSLDNWLLCLDERKGNETVRERFRYKKISEAIIQIKKGAKVYSPIYDPKTRKIVRKKSLNPIYINEGICIVDGVVALDIKELRNISDFNIFVDVDDGVRKKRLMKFYLDYKNCSVNESEKLINTRELEEVPTIKKTMNYADVIYKYEEFS